MRSLKSASLKGSTLIWLVLVLLTFQHCKNSTPTTPSTPASKPLTINSFSASPTSINKGQSSTLSWDVSNSTSVSIDQGIGAVSASGTTQVSPVIDTVYTLTAASGTQTLSSTAAVSVILPDCERLHTGVLHVSNLSSHGNDYNIIIDGVDRGRLKANASIDYTLTVGSHLVDFKYSDHDGYGCPTGNPSIVQCQTVSVSCTM